MRSPTHSSSRLSAWTIRRIFISVLLLLGVTQTAHAQSRTAFVHLFEWSWSDIAQECEQHLGPKGFAAVQVSPPQKSITRDEWWSRYQPISYEITGRSGNRTQFKNMVDRCEAVGVDIYVDAVINHMAALDRSFPEVPFGTNDFHSCASSNIDYTNRWQVQNCDLVNLNDLKTESDYVRQKIADYMNDLIGLGVAGFRIDAAKHIPVADIAAIKAKVNRATYIFQEVIGAAGEAISPSEYTGVGDVTEFNFERTIGHYFKGRAPLKDLQNIVNFSGWLPSDKAVVFVSNHDDQRQNTSNTLTYKDTSGLYYIGEIFALAYPYGYPKVMSSYRFEDHDQGPPANGANSGDACGVNWICEHRWRGVANMVGFRNATQAQFVLSNWWDNGNNQIAFGRGGLGFVAINREDNSTLSQNLQTGMPAGEYCDIVNGEFNSVTKTCGGPSITVGNDGRANFNVAVYNASAIHVGTKMDGGDSGGAIWADAYFRGTANSWGTTAMSFSDGLWRTTQTFGNTNPRFKISRFTDWSEAYPNQDVQITEGAGAYDITFNDSSKQINVSKQSGNSGNLVDVDFVCNNGNTVAGQSVYAIGSVAELGSWSPSNAIKLDVAGYPSWSKTIQLAEGQSVSWKCLKRNESNPSQGVEWQSGDNNTFNADSNKTTIGAF
ncbi:MAG: alpha amylase C-terminal domain-containing protein [Arenicella sp.]|nr:alpha amylase C-terminal domain-containing protein [Arenicella sp.]